MPRMTEFHIRPGAAPSPRGLTWLGLTRFAFLALCLAVMLLGAAQRSRFPFMPGPIALLFALVFALNLAGLLLLPRLRRHAALFVRLQLAGDLLAETVLLFLTGGVDSHFLYLFFASIMAASMILSRPESALAASLATISLAAVTILYLTGAGRDFVDPAFLPEKIDTAQILARMLAVATAFFLVAYLSGLLQARLAVARILNEEVLQNMPEGVAVFDHEYRAIFLNSEFARLFPRESRPSRAGEVLENIFPGDEFLALCRAIRQEGSWRFELEALANDRALPRPPLEIRIAPIGDGQRRRGVVAIFIDLTLRRQVEEAERRAERFEAIGEMAAGLAHEIRNPLASVRGSIQEIAADFPAGSSNRRLCEIVIKESDRLDHIIAEFLQFARARPLRLGLCRLPALLDEVRDLLATHPTGAGVELDFQCPGPAGALTVRGDADQLRDVFLNLGLNACAALEGRGCLAVRAAPERGSVEGPAGPLTVDGVRISFADNGPGLVPGTEERIFEPFYTTKPRGTGLGLAIVQRIVQSHNGRVEVESRRGAGATFACWLPLDGPHLPVRRRESRRTTKVTAKEGPPPPPQTET